MRRTVAMLLVAAALTACSAQGQQGQRSFDEALDAGADCSELFKIRNALKPDAPDIDRKNQRLRDIGCFSSTSSRTDG